MKKFKQWFAFLMLALMAAGAQAAAMDAPDQIVRAISRDVLDIIKKNDKDTNKVRDLVDARIAPLADYTRMTKLAVGRHWRTATPEQQQALVREFRLMLARTYLSAPTINKNARLDVKETRAGNGPDENKKKNEHRKPD